MTMVHLIRHGQANAGARTEAEYDRLSDLGRRQAALTGDYLARTDHGIRRIICGTLNRQRDTAAAIGQALGLACDSDPRLNEIDYFELEASLKASQGEFIPDTPATRDEFLLHFPQVMDAWKHGRISCPTEDFDGFEARVSAVLEESEAEGGTLLVTSGGVIGMMMRHVLDLSIEAFSHALLQAHNASIHRYQIEAGGRRLVTFNATPQFDAPEVSHARTFI